jgi:Zn-dependent protease with chaperone function
MDFFAAQDDARKRTGRFLWLFALAVALTTLSVHIAAELLLGWSRHRGFEFHPHWNLLPWTVGATLLPIVITALVRWTALSNGGGAVAEALGGRRVAPDTADFHEKRLLNVVEEVAIASGLRVPEIWVLDDEAGINAFAAGTDPSCAAVAVSRGCLEHLSRDELQGVIGHECSHILNGDMRLNVHTMAWIAGIASLFVLGQVLVRLAFHTVGSVSVGNSDSRKKNDANALPMLLFVGGVALLIAGSVGAFFARLIQSAISRQREFLADASAVQFTRNPDGICNALKKIGGYVHGSRIQAVRSSEVAHMFFCEGSAGFFADLFATHPPLPERIKRLDPGWSGAVTEGGAQSTPFKFTQEVSVSAQGVGMNVEQGPEMTAITEHSWMVLARNPETAGQVLLDVLGAFEDESALETPRGLTALSVAERVSLLEVAFSSARQLPRTSVRALLQQCEEQVVVDGSYNLFEMMLLQSIRRHLGVASGIRSPAPVRYEDGMSLRGAFQVVLSAMAVLGTEDHASRDAAFALGWAVFGLGEAERLDVAQIPVSVIENALGECEQGTAALRGALLKGCVLVVETDGVMTVLEAALLRAVADAVGVPLPSIHPNA